MAEEEKVKEEKPKKQKPAKKEKSHKISRYFKDLKGEMGKITWFSAHDTFQNSLWVIVALVIFTVVIGGVNLGFSEIITLLGRIGK